MEVNRMDMYSRLAISMRCAQVTEAWERDVALAVVVVRIEKAAFGARGRSRR